VCLPLPGVPVFLPRNPGIRPHLGFLLLLFSWDLRVLADLHLVPAPTALCTGLIGCPFQVPAKQGVPRFQLVCKTARPTFVLLATNNATRASLARKLVSPARDSGLLPATGLHLFSLRYLPRWARDLRGGIGRLPNRSMYRSHSTPPRRALSLPSLPTHPLPRSPGSPYGPDTTGSR
jgi:hypothetical protein